MSDEVTDNGDDFEDEKNFTIEYGGQTFEIGEPNSEIVLRILNCLGKIGTRGEGAAVRVMRKPTTLATLFGLMAVLDEQDIAELGSAVFQFEDKAKGKKFMREQSIRVAPVIKALFFNLEQSTDLVESISAFFGGIEGLALMIDKMVPANTSLAALLAAQATMETTTEES